MLESEFKPWFLDRLERRLRRHGVELDFIPTKPHIRSFPDTLVIGPRFWAALEFKRAKSASKQANQDYHVDRLDEKGYSRFVNPDNAEEILDELEHLFTLAQQSCVP